MRGRVLLDVSNLVRRTKVVNLPSGGQTIVRYDFERLHKRCYTCQRLTYEQEKCPIYLNKDVIVAEGEKQNKDEGSREKVPVLKRDDPRSGVLSEEQVGINPATGQPRIQPEVLEGMSIYMMTDPHTDRVVKERRVRNSIEALKNDPNGQAMLTLEPVPLIWKDLDKGKGIVFNYEQTQKDIQESQMHFGQDILLSSVIQSGNAIRRGQRIEENSIEVEAKLKRDRIPLISSSPTGYRIGFYDVGSFGIAKKRQKPRKRPHMSNRKPR